MGDGVNVTTALTGMLPMILLVAAALTVPVAWLLLRQYRRAVIRSMAGTSAGAAPALPAGEGAAEGARRKLQLRSVDVRDDASDSALYRRAQRSALALCAVYVAAGLAYALVLSGPWMIFAGEDGFVLSRFLWLMAAYVWPLVLTLGIVFALGRSERALLGAGYFLLLALVASYALGANPQLEALQLVRFWLIVNAAPSVLLLAFLQRRVRAVGPLVLAFMLAAVAGSQLLLSLIGASDRGMRAAVEVGALWGLGGSGIFFTLMAIGFVLSGFLGWWLLRRLGERYRRRAMSDQTLMLDSLWLVFGIVQSITFAFEGWAWLLTGLAGFVAYKLVAVGGFRVLQRQSVGPAATLLLLRVFALGRRSERVFDALRKRWLRIGSITLIAGPDLVASTVEPHEILDFVGGGVAHRFIRDDADLERRMQSMTLGCDPDGRYRVNEFFCYADTWQRVMQRLARDADAVVMDLRSFARGNEGCVYEIEQLLGNVDLGRVLLLVDASTDEPFLRQAVQSAWERVAASVPGAGADATEIRVLRLDGYGRRPVLTLLRTLMHGSRWTHPDVGVAVPT